MGLSMSSTPPPSSDPPNIDPPPADICDALCQLRDILADAYQKAEGNEELQADIASAQAIVEEQIDIHDCTC